MSLVHEATVRFPGFSVGDLKIAHYSISYSAGAVVKPSNDPSWILLNGCSLDTTTYAALFAIYGYSYGGSGANFNLPDLTEGRIPITKGLTNFTSLAASGGEINHTLTSAEMPSHNHSATGLSWQPNAHGHSTSITIDQADSHTHVLGSALSNGHTIQKNTNGLGTVNSYSTTTGATTSGASANHFHSGSLSTNLSTPSGSISGSVTSLGSGGSHNNMQPYIVVGGWLVKFQ